MHFGNLSVLVEPEGVARGRFSLAPVYDLLPMRWRPDPASGALDLASFQPAPADLSSAARPLAIEFRRRVAAQAAVSRAFRALAQSMARRLG